MTPAQEAKQYALDNGFEIRTVAKKYEILRDDNSIGLVSGYPAALNLMKKHVPDNRQQIPEEEIISEEVLNNIFKIWNCERYRTEIWYSKPDSNGINGYVRWCRSYKDAIKFLRKHLSGPNGKDVFVQTISYVESDYGTNDARNELSAVKV